MNHEHEHEKEQEERKEEEEEEEKLSNEPEDEKEKQEKTNKQAAQTVDGTLRPDSATRADQYSSETKDQSRDAAGNKTSELLIEGFLYKQSHGLLKRWQHRYFVITRHCGTDRLIYGRSEDELRSDLRIYQVRINPRSYDLSALKTLSRDRSVFLRLDFSSDIQQHRSALTGELTAEVGGPSTLELQASSKAEAEAWEKTLQRYLTQVNFVSNPIASPTLPRPHFHRTTSGVKSIRHLTRKLSRSFSGRQVGDIPTFFFRRSFWVRLVLLFVLGFCLPLYGFMLGVACAGGRRSYNLCTHDDDCVDHECIDQAGAIILLLLCFAVLIPWMLGFISMLIPDLLEVSIHYLRRGLGLLLGVVSFQGAHSTSTLAAAASRSSPHQGSAAAL
jgi:hypothetical protein